MISGKIFDVELETPTKYVLIFSFPDLTERYYRDKFWPDEEKVRAVVGDDQGLFYAF